LVACWLQAPAAAQTTGGRVQLDRYQPTPFSDRVLRLDSPGVLPFGQYRVGADVDYALRPLVLVDATAASGSSHNIVEHAVGTTLLASFGLGRRLEIGLSVPLTVYQGGETTAGALTPSAAGVGNVRLGLKARLLEGSGLAVGATIVAGVPGGIGTLTHETGVSGEGRLFASYRRRSLLFGARAGLLMRPHAMFYDVSLGNELTVAAGVTWQARLHTSAFTELAGGTALARPFADAKQSPLEVLAGLRHRIGRALFTVAGGPGLVNGYGSPLFRLVAGFTWANVPPDGDGDGIPDDDDRCPADAEDRDGFEDADGCPDPDNDKDGIPDITDRCPNQPEDRDGFEDADGCPDPDNDQDGIPDAADKCPDAPETINDFEDDDGCPDKAPPASDKDKDGIPDDIDECPEEPEDKDGFEDTDGCPDPDNDKDGIADAVDKCPLEPETINGIDDDDGCPDKGPSQVRLGKTEIETLQPIYFDTDRSRVRHAFYNVLGQIGSLLKAHPEIGRCAVEGHTDDTGPPDWNQKLSLLRAAAVIEFLANKGVDPKRLVAIGHGEELPWASNETPEGRAKNRRVVFHIEGVNPEEQERQELRQERRRRIRRRREAEQKLPAPQPGESRESEGRIANPVVRGGDVGVGVGGGSVDPSNKKTAAPGLPMKLPGPVPGPANAKMPASPEPGPKAPLRAPPPPAPSAPPVSRPSPGPFYGPAPAPIGRKASPKPTSVPLPPAAPGPAPTESAPSKEGKPGAAMPPVRPTTRSPAPSRKRPPEGETEEPRTLRDLLKLPPR
jgi:outer membrane protein OmpA-like peptidoglycan-associated protein